MPLPLGYTNIKTKLFTSTTLLKAQTVLSTRQLIGRNLCCSSSGISHFLGLIHPYLIAASASRTCKELCHGEIAGPRTLNPFLDTGFQDRLTTNYHTISYLRVFPPSRRNKGFVLEYFCPYMGRKELLAVESNFEYARGDLFHFWYALQDSNPARAGYKPVALTK